MLIDQPRPYDSLNIEETKNVFAQGNESNTKQYYFKVNERIFEQVWRYQTYTAHTSLNISFFNPETMDKRDDGRFVMKKPPENLRELREDEIPKIEGLTFRHNNSKKSKEILLKKNPKNYDHYEKMKYLKKKYHKPWKQILTIINLKLLSRICKNPSL